MNRAPAFQFYTGDWRKDPCVQALDHSHKGVWIDLLCVMWDSVEPGRVVLPNGTPMPDDAIARNLGIPEAEWKQTRSTLLAYGVASEDEAGVLYNRRMVRDEETRLKKVEAGRKGGLARKSPSKTQANGGSSSSSSSSSFTAVYPPAEGDARTREASEPTESDRRGDDASELAVWLGDDHADVVERFVEAVGADARTLTSIFRTFGPKGTQGERILAKLNADEQRSAMAASLEALIGERQAYRQNFFRAILASNVSALVGEKPEGGNDPGRINPSTFDDDLDKEMLRQTGGIPGRGSS